MQCPKCGQILSDGTMFCNYCGTQLNQATAQTAHPAEPGKPENFVSGTVGAMLGAAIGGAAIILLSRIGLVAAISGVILAVCTLKGYELLGGRLSAKGIVICALLMLIMPYLADRLDWAIVIMQQAESEGLNWSLGECFQIIPELTEEGIISEDDYVANLVQLYLFTGLGVLGSVFGNKKKTKA